METSASLGQHQDQGDLEPALRPDSNLRSVVSAEQVRTCVTNPGGGPSDAVDDVFGSTVRAGMDPGRLSYYGRNGFASHTIRLVT